MVVCDRHLSLRVMFSRLIHVRAVLIGHSLLLLNDIPLYTYNTFHLSIHQLMDNRVVPGFWVFWITLLWTFTYRFLCRYLFTCNQIETNTLQGSLPIYLLYWRGKIKTIIIEYLEIHDYYINIILKLTVLYQNCTQRKIHRLKCYIEKDKNKSI